jgi:hypothetical protein
MINQCGAADGMRIGRRNKLGENLPQCHFVHNILFLNTESGLMATKAFYSRQYY